MNEKRLLWLAIVAGIVAVVCVEMYVGARVGEPVAVLVATRDISEGRAFQSADLKVEQMPKLPPGALTPANGSLLAPSAGVRTRGLIHAGSPILFSDLATPDEMRLSDRIPVDLRALSIPVTRSSSVTNMIHPDDLVEILVPAIAGPGNQPPVIERVPGSFKVIACGSRLGEATADTPSYDTVTLLVTPAEAQTIVAALSRQHGGNGATLLLCGRQK